ncbi:hypothetical protein AGMMS50229_10890 [Campylobacterota bacterium]|nr:hypothetical protein AGMMS50229_10890 [Campylobacterota bacterium]
MSAKLKTDLKSKIEKIADFMLDTLRQIGVISADLDNTLKKNLHDKLDSLVKGGKEGQRPKSKTQPVIPFYQRLVVAWRCFRRKCYCGGTQ